VTEYLDLVRTIGGGELADRMGIEILEAAPDRMVGRMPVAGNRQPFGLLHGGANVVLAESLGSIAAALHGGAQRYPVGIEVSATHHRSATSGHVTATCTALSLGRTIAAYEIVVVDDEGNRTCTARLTCLLRDRPAS
jgi:uncharacterized protein (TIGR00369 family)